MLLLGWCSGWEDLPMSTKVSTFHSSFLVPPTCPALAWRGPLAPLQEVLASHISLDKEG